MSTFVASPSFVLAIPYTMGGRLASVESSTQGKSIASEGRSRFLRNCAKRRAIDEAAIVLGADNFFELTDSGVLSIFRHSLPRPRECAISSGCPRSSECGVRRRGQRRFRWIGPVLSWLRDGRR